MKQNSKTESEPFTLNIESILARSEQEIRAQVIEDAKKAFSQQLGWALESKIKASVDEFFQAEILPALRDDMVAAKPEILKSIKVGLLKTAEALGEALYQNASAKLSRSYSVGSIAKELFS